MNHKWIAICICSVAALAATGCRKPEENNVYATLNALAEKAGASVTLSVTTETDGETLSGTYTSETRSDGVYVEYSYERFNLIQTEGGYVMPDSLKSTYSGNLTVRDGEIVAQEGDKADLSLGEITAAFSFAEEYFTDVTEEDGSFRATVTDPSSFLRKELTCSEMKVTVTYSAEALLTLTVTYRSEASSLVTLSYLFS